MLKDEYIEYVHENGFDEDLAQLRFIEFIGTYKKKIEAKKSKNLLYELLKKLIVAKTQTKRGVYLWGDVGRGKSMLMDLFFHSLPTKQKKRMHFHDFMRLVHKELESLRNNTKNKYKKNDHIKLIADKFSAAYGVIYLDELQVNNIADAMIIGRLFKRIINNGTYVFFTSNREPGELFKDGLQRDRFLSFIQLVKSSLDVFYLDNSRDYRAEKLDTSKLYFSPLGKKADQFIDNIIFQLTDHTKLNSEIIEVAEDNHLQVHNCYGHLVVFSFKELCEMPLGILDYTALSKKFNLFIIRNVPKLGKDNHNEALRFITLIDCLYENKTRLICTAETTPEKIYGNGKHSFEFKRTVSRLKEMTTEGYYSSYSGPTIYND